MATHSAAPTNFDELDPHGAGAHGQHASHAIVGPFTLRLILLILLFLTVLTVGQAQLEVYLAREFHIDFPRWVNVAFCMSIAVVKAVLVMLYFMQLRYDNPINSVVMAFTFLALALFLGFTALDLGTRASVYDWKSTGTIVGPTNPAWSVKGARDRAIEKWGVEEFNRRKAEYEAEHGHAHHAAPAGPASTASQSRPTTGLSGALSASDAPHTEGHAPAHSEAPAPAPGTPAGH